MSHQTSSKVAFLFCVLAFSLVCIPSATAVSSASDEIRGTMNEMLTSLYEVLNKMISQHEVFVAYCEISSESVNDQLTSYADLIAESEALLDTYNPLLESNEDELTDTEEEHNDKTEELDEGRDSREDEALESQETVAEIEEDLVDVEYLLGELDADSISMTQMSETLGKMHSQTSLMQNVVNTVTELIELGSINLETKSLLISMLTQLESELISLKDLEIESEELAEARWEELEVTLEARLEQLEITMSQLKFQVEIYNTIISDNEKQCDMYNARVSMLEEMYGLLESGCSAEDLNYGEKEEEISAKINAIEQYLS